MIPAGTGRVGREETMVDLREARERVGLSREEAACRVVELGVPIDAATIGRLESGDVRVERDLVRLAGLAAAYGVKLGSLVPDDQRQDAIRFVSMFRDKPV